jgi:hypothetical protein
MIILIVISCIISTTNNQSNNRSQILTETNNEQKEIQAEDNIDKSISIIKISSNEYYDLVNTTIKNNIGPTAYTINKISTLRAPYYSVDCKAINIDVSNFKSEILKISENIYNTLLEHKFKRPNIFIPSYEIISLTFSVESNGKISHTLCIQFDLTDIDRRKTFLENLKIPTIP